MAETENENDNLDKLNEEQRKKDQEMIDKLVQERVDNSLKDIKSKLDNAYNSRDTALKKLAEFEQKEKEAEIKRLQEEGKFKEAFEMQLAEEKAKRETLEKRNVELTRDLDVKSVLNTYEFKNQKAINMAFSEISSQLVQNEQGVWVHRSGISIADFVKTFCDNEENAFLLKAKTNSGSGSSGSLPNNNLQSGTKKSLFEMSQDEVLQMAREGKLTRK